MFWIIQESSRSLTRGLLARIAAARSNLPASRVEIIAPIVCTPFTSTCFQATVGLGVEVS